MESGFGLRSREDGASRILDVWRGLGLMLGWGGCRAVWGCILECVVLGGGANERFGDGMGRSGSWISVYQQSLGCENKF